MRPRHIQHEQTASRLHALNPLPVEQSPVEKMATISTVPTQEAEPVEALTATLSQELKAHQTAARRGLGGMLLFCFSVMALSDYTKNRFGEDWWWNAGVGIFL